MSELSALAGDWRELAARGRNVFATWAWADAWWRHFGDGRELRVRHEAGSYVLPLFVERQGPFRILRFIGSGHSDEVGPIGDAARASAAFAAERNYHLFLGDEMAPGWAEPLGARVVERTSSPVIELSGSWDDYLGARSSNFRGQVRSAERRLENASYRLATHDTLDADLDTLFRLHRARWPSSHWFADSEAFHRDFATIALHHDWLRLWTLELGSTPAAAWLGYRFNGVESYYQAGRDPTLQRERVGFVLLAHTIREAIQDGMSEYRLLRGDESFKYRFATGDPGLETLARPNGALGRLALALRSVRRHAT